MKISTAREDSMTESHAPIAVFAYKRAHHLAQCIESLAVNTEAQSSHLYVYCDGARTPADVQAVERVRSYVTQIRGFASVTPVLRDHNVGLARSIVEGVGRVLEAHDRVIVVEDDLLLSRHFLRYMNDGLNFYAASERVASVHGYCYPVREPLPEAFFLRGADCWGWATWRRQWRHFNPDGRALLAELQERNLIHAFDLDGAYPFTRMLQDQIAGRNDSWAVRWHASCFLKDLLTLYPGKTLVRNMGNDASGTHSKATGEYDGEMSQFRVRVDSIPVEPSIQARTAFMRFLRPSLWNVSRRLVDAAYVRMQGFFK